MTASIPPALSLSLEGTPTLAWVLIAVLAAGVLGFAYVARVRSGRSQRMTEDLQHSTLHVTTIVDAALDGIVTMDQDGRITGFNPRAEQMLGWDAEEVDGRLVSEVLVPERHRLDHEKGLSHWRRTGEGPLLGRVRELTALRKDGGEVPIDLSISLGVKDGERATFVAFLHDVSARQRAERIQGLRFVVASVLSEASTLPDATQGVVTAVGTRLHVPFAAMWTPTLGGLGCEQVYSADPERSSGLLQATRAATIAVGNGLPGRAWAAGRLLSLDDVASSHEDFERLRAAAAGRLSHAVAIPVVASDRVLAVLEVFTDRRDDLDDETLRTLDDVCAQLGQFLARRRAEMLQDSPERLALLVEGATEPVVTVAEDGAITALNDRARRLFGYTSLEVMGEDLRVLIADGHREQVIEYVSDVLRLTQHRPPRYCDLVARRKDGTTFDAGIHITPLVVGGRQVFVCLVDEPPAADARTTGGTAELRVYPGRDAQEQRPRLA